ncbi:MAG: glycosyltransferase family 39 protein [Acidobacteria bacterium]|nr:glycosyltransferase family 39 protein [Acidobacteriota bacterium]
MRANGRMTALWPVIGLILTAIYIGGNPPLAAAARHLSPALFALVFAAAFVGWGALPALALLPQRGATDRLLIAGVIGAGLTGLLTFIPGVFGFVSAPVYALWTFVGLALLAWRGPRLVSGRRASVPRPEPLGVLAAVIITLNLVQLIPMLVSPVVSTDAMEYHLMIPKIALATGQIAPLPSLVESNYPGLMSFIYLLVMPLAGDIACKAVHFLAGIGVLFAIARLVDRVAPEANRLLAPALYLTMPVAAIIFGWAWNDNFFILCILLGLGQLLDFNEDPALPRSVRHLLAAGILLGLAAWTKYTIVMILSSLAPLLVVAMWKWRWRPLQVAILVAPIGAISLLVFVKNAVFTGNPFYPFLHTLFPNPMWTDTTAAFFKTALQKWEIPTWHWHTPVTFVIHMVFKPRLIDIHTGVLPLLAAPFLLLRSTTRAQTFLKLFVLFHIFAWYLFRTETRSLLSLFAVILVLAAPEIERTLFSVTGRKRAALLAVSAAALTSLSVTVISSWILTEPMKYFFGLEKTTTFLSREVAGFDALDWINTHDEVRGAVLVGFKHPYYAAKPVWFSAFSDIPIAEVLTGSERTPADLRKKLKILGATHIVLDQTEWIADHKDGLYAWPDARRTVFEDLLEDHCSPVARFGETTIFRLEK